MNKKELKEFINKNGFFLHITELNKLDKNFIEENKISVPKGDNILVFSGVASQAFGKGEVSRNGYKIDPKGWDLTNYLKNPQILLSHNGEEPIGKAISVSATEKGLEINFYINLDWVKDEADKNRLRDGAYSTLSTGHITKEYKFENKENGEILSVEEAEKKYGIGKWELFYSDAWNFVVTKAELIEVSMVTTPSNPDALTAQNTLESFKNSIFPKERGGENNVSKTEDEETPPVPPFAENAIVVEKNDEVSENSVVEKNEKPMIDENSFIALQNSFSELNEKLSSQENKIKILEENLLKKDEILKVIGNSFLEQSILLKNMEQKLNSTPIFKGMAFKTPKQDNTTGLGQMLKSL